MPRTRQHMPRTRQTDRRRARIPRRFWKADLFGTTSYEITADGLQVAMVRGGSPADKEAAANASLIAVAPEMQFELQTGLEDINTAIDNSRVWTRQQLVKHLMEVQRRMGALLAKIERKE